jgi:hypothetical protein
MLKFEILQQMQKVRSYTAESSKLHFISWDYPCNKFICTIFSSNLDIVHIGQ